MMRLGIKGQAATEFVISAVFVLVPLFLIIPLLGKYIDIRHASVNQARYEAWEYTVWKGPDERIKYGVEESQSAGRKSKDNVEIESAKLFLIDPFQDAYGTDSQESTLNPLWIDHHGDSLFYDVFRSGDGLQESDSPDPTGGILNTVFSVFETIYDLFGDLLRGIGVDATFDAVYNEAYYSSELQTKVRSIDQIIPLTQLDSIDSGDHDPLLFQARASVQSDFWNAGSTDVAVEQSKGLVFSAVLSPITSFINDIINAIQDAMNFVGKYIGLEITMPHLPDFGYVAEDLVPYEHLEAVSDDGHGEETLPSIHEANGLYYYTVGDDD